MLPCDNLWHTQNISKLTKFIQIRNKLDWLHNIMTPKLLCATFEI